MPPPPSSPVLGRGVEEGGVGATFQPLPSLPLFLAWQPPGDVVTPLPLASCLAHPLGKEYFSESSLCPLLGVFPPPAHRSVTLAQVSFNHRTFAPRLRWPFDNLPSTI